MTLAIEKEAVPFSVDSDGVVRVGKTRVTLNTIVTGYCQVFCVKFLSASFLKNGRFLRTFPIGFDFQCNSILRQINARRV